MLLHSLLVESVSNLVTRWVALYMTTSGVNIGFTPDGTLRYNKGSIHSPRKDQYWLYGINQMFRGIPGVSVELFTILNQVRIK